MADRAILVDRTAEPIETRASFEARMAKKREAEEKDDAEIAERFRQDYLRRTHRTMMKP